MSIKKWKSIKKELGVRFQPVVNIFSGSLYGISIDLDGWDNAGFDSPDAFYSFCLHHHYLDELYSFIMRKTLREFSKFPNNGNSRIIVKTDVLPVEKPETIIKLLKDTIDAHQIPSQSVFLEISLKQSIDNTNALIKIINSKGKRHFPVLLNNFGTGISGYEILYNIEPAVIRIDPFLTNGIDQDSKKKLFVGTIVNMAHILGIIVIAQNILTENEILTCKDLGIDMIQGDVIEKPLNNILNINSKYDIISTLTNIDRRRLQQNESDMLLSKLEKVTPLYIDSDIWMMLDKFKKDKTRTLLPVVNSLNEPLGAILEQTIKPYIYSPFGKEILLNKTTGKDLFSFLSPCPIADIRCPTAKILEMFILNNRSEGIILTENGVYQGVLSAKSLLTIMNEKEIAKARDENPLTRLPGNNAINQYIVESLNRMDINRCFTYFDLNHFKPYNDKYGFRQGDRVIRLFSDILREKASGEGIFIGHIGGDDFFIGIDTSILNGKDSLLLIRDIVSKFSSDVRGFYDETDRANGFITSKDRDGNTREFPILGVSAAAVLVRSVSNPVNPEDLGFIIAGLKKEAKQSPDFIAFQEIPFSVSPELSLFKTNP